LAHAREGILFFFNEQVRVGGLIRLASNSLGSRILLPQPSR
jgi:hypothetical protein